MYNREGCEKRASLRERAPGWYANKYGRSQADEGNVAGRPSAKSKGN